MRAPFTALFRPLPLLLAAVLAACNGSDNTASPQQAPGEAQRTSTRALEAGADALQSRPPIEAINAYLNGFHFYSGAPDEQMEAHHYCGYLNEEVIQCAIYDGNAKDAKLMGVEYIVSRKLFETLPAAEKPLWHSHVHEVKSGQLIAPGLPDAAERALMARLVGTYGKTWHTWHTDRQKELPLGVPQLMMGFTADGQLDAALLAARNQRFGIDTEAKKRDRASLASPPVAEGAHGSGGGPPVQLADPTGQDLNKAHQGPR
ncbi:MAG: DUF1264 domain-containing protein [Comamonadaceae bacterium]|nr:MAG: DUF1264 domain-containing protein [Comamonadaceae bacterium]